MKQNHRSAELDALLNQRVRVTFCDNTQCEGILTWTEKFKPPMYLKPQTYHLLQDNGIYYGFRKSHIKRVEKI